MLRAENYNPPMSATRAANRLANETSPYLFQHAHNPVDWYPWGEEAFEKARREEKPVFLSIGYSSCHWCHVMERESFESEEVAAILNERFVSIKVDREERPDIDDVYMTFVQLTVGHGGWPLSAFLLPDGRPFFGGTYFPPEDRHGRAGFKTLLLRLSETWRDRREDVEGTGARMAEEIAGAGKVTERHAVTALSPDILPRLTQALARSFDAEHGGFGGAPKFPPHMSLEWLLLRGARGDEDALRMATKTLDAMALGGIHDQLGGGFHRYSTDEHWLVPHFEEMLSDNAQLLGLYARGFAVTARPLYRRVALGIGEYLLRDMRGPEGAFFTATDADSEGEEGKYFVWTESEIAELLGEDAALFERRYQVRANGNYRDEATGRPAGRNILHLREEPGEEEEALLAPLRAKLLAARGKRVPPALDDKRVSGWNALAISGLATAARVLGDARFLEAAGRAARFLLTTMRDGSGTLLRSWKDGAGKVPAFLEDEAYLANALLDLAEATTGAAAEEWLAEARRAADSLVRRFARRGEPGFTFSGEGHERLLSSGRDFFDKATPSGSASAARALVRLALATNEVGGSAGAAPPDPASEVGGSGARTLASEARAALEEVSFLLSRAPRGTESWHLALAELLEFETRFGAVEARTSSARAEARSSPLSVEVVATPARMKRGGRIDLAVRIAIEDGFYLLADGGLRVEAWAGADVVASPFEAPEPVAIAHEDGTAEPGFENEVEARLRLDVAAGATPGDRTLSVLVRTRACGEGVCRPEALLSLSLPIAIEA
jgi:uncharacterized protein YyaL (SSP411 family)